MKICRNILRRLRKKPPPVITVVAPGVSDPESGNIIALLTDAQSCVHGKSSTRLLLCVLEEALRTFQRSMHSADESMRRSHREVKEWFWSDDDKWPFAFLAICKELRLDPEYIRAGLQQIEEKE